MDVDGIVAKLREENARLTEENAALKQELREVQEDDGLYGLRRSESRALPSARAFTRLARGVYARPVGLERVNMMQAGAEEGNARGRPVGRLGDVWRMLTPHLAAACAQSSRTPSENDIYMPLASKLRAHHHLPRVTYEAIMATYGEEGGMNGSGSERPVSLFIEKEVGGGGGQRSVRHLALKDDLDIPTTDDVEYVWSNRRCLSFWNDSIEGRKPYEMKRSTLRYASIMNNNVLMNVFAEGDGQPLLALYYKYRYKYSFRSLHTPINPARH